MEYIAYLHSSFQPKTAKCKIACIKAFCAWLEYEELLTANPFQKIQTKFREPFHLPRTIPIEQIQLLLNTVCAAREQARTPYQGIDKNKHPHTSKNADMGMNAIACLPFYRRNQSQRIEQRKPLLVKVIEPTAKEREYLQDFLKPSVNVANESELLVAIVGI